MLIRPSRMIRAFKQFLKPIPSINSINHLQSSRMASTLPRLPVFEAISKHDPESTVVIHAKSGRRFTYGQLLRDVADTRDKLRQSVGEQSTDGQRVAFLVENSYDYVGATRIEAESVNWPLLTMYSDIALDFRFQSKADEVLKEGLEKRPISSTIDKKLEGNQSGECVQLEDNPDDQSGMMLYTSGTTSRPKGVVLPGSVLTAQSQSLKQAWEYTPNDHLLHVLPLHHIHGTVNALLTPLFAGSTIEFLFPFNVQAVWERLAAPFQADETKKKEKITFLT
ncbi:MAG: hypothetical protein Q9171_007535, partial [Xanthocarpia ochracea]